MITTPTTSLTKIPLTMGLSEVISSLLNCCQSTSLVCPEWETAIRSLLRDALIYSGYDLWSMPASASDATNALSSYYLASIGIIAYSSVTYTVEDLYLEMHPNSILELCDLKIVMDGTCDESTFIINSYSQTLQNLLDYVCN